MSVYLLTWNPKHFSTGGEGSEPGTLDYAVGEQVRWSCHSQQPKLGDTIYLIRLGVEPRGIVAKGTVSKESYLADHWSDASKEKRYIDFKLEGLRSSCEQGLLPMMLLQGSMPDQQWSPQTSGIEIKQNYRETLADLWESGEGKHAVEQFFNWYLANQFNPQGWHKDYVETCELVDQIKNGKEITKQDVKKLWYDVSNGIASVGQGFMYQREFDANYEFLLGLTREILANPTEQTYQKVLKDWKQSGTFERVLWGVIHRVFSAADPQHYTSVVAQAYVNDVYTCLKQQYQLHTKRSGSWFSDNRDLLELTAPFLTKDIDVQTRNILLWSLYEWKATNKNEDTDGHDQVRDNEANYEVSQSMINSIAKPLNQILYGPPGTGKTYHTIEAAVTAAEPTFVWTNRSELKEKYDQLVTAKRIRFVTFHQSYGYEEFVEGLAASSIDGQISYEVKSGIFKDICEQASRGVEQSNDPLEIAIEALKSELEEGASLSLSTQRGKMFDIQYHGNTTFRAFPHETTHEDLGNGYPVSIDSIRKLYNGSDAKEFYNPSYVKAILKHLVKTYSLPTEPIVETKESKNFVLVIDEINRGNISKIFGELITLIEESKRTGDNQTESIEVILPHSGQKFSVPRNLYIIGTMNTADRSLAMMDTALRRRFNFIEMMPKPELLEGVKVKGIDLQRLLEVLNQRIEILYDREHTLGHAFFMPVKALVDQDKEELAFSELQSVFQNKIIPLLEEYFFEDWSKIRLVLADNQKSQEIQFIKEHIQTNQDLNALFGVKHNLDQYGQSVVKYTLADKADEVWCDSDSYISIYSKVSKTSDEDQEFKTSREMVTE
ncbi:McrB family protein [Vibrio vulnificus]|uniref:McrB family protein n=1 Tax=Vibrio vulnificus TaxID=672 RepID=UPI00102B6303|nr:AAA family ATPase [Vibrio vulnificus]EGQ9300153.1 AAA domain-containing protein [Vibrio vulnificus]RZR10975.1 AAA family ATPase [Vibrio vulnificus]